VAAVVSVPATAGRAGAAPEPAVKPQPIDLVLCLDVSGSMNGLIDSAKIKLWDIVNEMARLKPTPDLRVALYSYGHSTYPAGNGWVRKENDLTADLDDVYKSLNALTISGGTELVGRVGKAALSDQKWSQEAGALKLIFVCGNEPANQDKVVGLDEIQTLSKKQGVIVNTIYCGAGANPEARGWADLAESCNGRFVNIDMNKAAQQIAIKTEYDEKILKLSEELNKTYVAYGAQGEKGALNQLAQDANAAKAPGAGGPAAPSPAAFARAASKAGALYRNSAWDLVDRLKEDKDFDITKLKDEELCDEMKKLKPEERLAYVKKRAEEREKLQKEITDLSAKRQKKIDEELAKQPKSDTEKALDEAVKGVVRDQAKAKGFEIEKK
jgi:hypothetical protein